MIKIALVGDVLITRPLPENGYNGLDKLVELISQHDVKFANLETTVHRNEGYPSAFPGGTWVMTDPVCLKDVNRLGFNILNTANNHAMDYSHKGLLATHKQLLNYGFPSAGTGVNLAEASSPTFVECSHGRVALIGATSSFHDSDAAGNQGINMPGRPGVNPLRHKSVYEITEDNFMNLAKIAEETGINSYHDQAIKEGYLLKKDNFNFASFEFKKGVENRLHTTPLEKDWQRIKKSIVEAKKQSDHVIVSIHSHQFSDGDKKRPAEFIRTFSQWCIDAGASIVVGHGPHILRGIEVYKSGVIFHGLGNFIFQNETVSHLPAEFYEKYSLEYNEGVGSAMDKRSKNGTIGLNVDKDVWDSVLVSAEFDEKRVSIKLYPIDLGFEQPRYRKGLPKIANNNNSLETLKELSSYYDTEIEIEDGVGIIEFCLE